MTVAAVSLNHAWTGLFDIMSQGWQVTALADLANKSTCLTCVWRVSLRNINRAFRFIVICKICKASGWGSWCGTGLPHGLKHSMAAFSFLIMSILVPLLGPADWGAAGEVSCTSSSLEIVACLKHLHLGWYLFHGICKGRDFHNLLILRCSMVSWSLNWSRWCCIVTWCGLKVPVEIHKRLYLQADKHYKKYLFQTKKEMLRNKLNSGSKKSKTLYKITKSLTSDASENTLPTPTSPKELANTFANLFVDKVNKFRSKFQNDENYQIPTRNCKT